MENVRNSLSLPISAVSSLNEWSFELQRLNFSFEIKFLESKFEIKCLESNIWNSKSECAWMLSNWVELKLEVLKPWTQCWSIPVARALCHWTMSEPPERLVIQAALDGRSAGSFKKPSLGVFLFFKVWGSSASWPRHFKETLSLREAFKI